MNLESLNTEIFSIKHLEANDSDILESFSLKKGIGLETYLKNYAVSEEREGKSRTYLISDNETHELVAYFTLKSGTITIKTSLLSLDNTTGIELANFAVNSNYKQAHDAFPKMGKYVFVTFILPLVQEISHYIGAQFLYIYALPNEKLMNYYRTMGFERTSEKKVERYIHKYLRPRYDKYCIFMFQKIHII